MTLRKILADALMLVALSTFTACAETPAPEPQEKQPTEQEKPAAASPTPAPPVASPMPAVPPPVEEVAAPKPEAPKGTPGDTRPLKTIKLDPDNINVVMAWDAQLHGGLKSFPGLGGQRTKEQRDKKNWKKYTRGSWWVEPWETSEDAVVWTVDAPQASTYVVYMVASGRESVMEVSCGQSKSTAWVDNNLDVMWDINHYPPEKKNAKWGAEFKYPDEYTRFVWAGWDRIPMGTIDLPAGVSEVKVRAKKAGPVLAVTCIELVRPETEVLFREKAKKLRSDTTWLADAKYGVFFHWTSSVSTKPEDAWKASHPRTGDRKIFPGNVDAFDADQFAAMVNETGAGFVTFTATWAEHSFPAPIKAIDAVLPGRTSKRDLVMDLADALAKYKIPLILYYHAPGDREWRNASEVNFSDKWCAIMEEVGNRYKEKLAGWWFDCGGVYWFDSVRFDRFAEAAKTGNPKRIIAYNNASFWPKVTDFQDYLTGEGPQFWMDQALLRYIPKGGNGIFSGGRHAGLQASLCFTMDSEWIHGVKDKEIPKPMWNKKLLIEQVKEAVERKYVPFIGFALYEDGTPLPETLDLMKALKKAIRGD